MIPGTSGGIAALLSAAGRMGDEALLVELADDIGDGLYGEADSPCDIGAGDGPVESYRLEYDPPVIRPAKFLVGPFERHGRHLVM
jgi:hypothetical protein